MLRPLPIKAHLWYFSPFGWVISFPLVSPSHLFPPSPLSLPRKREQNPALFSPRYCCEKRVRQKSSLSQVHRFPFYKVKPGWETESSGPNWGRRNKIWVSHNKWYWKQARHVGRMRIVWTVSEDETSSCLLPMLFRHGKTRTRTVGFLESKFCFSCVKNKYHTARNRYFRCKTKQKNRHNKKTGKNPQ